MLDFHNSLKILGSKCLNHEQGLRRKHHTVYSSVSLCHMNKSFNQIAGQAAHKSYPPCVVRATDIAMEAYNNSH